MGEYQYYEFRAIDRSLNDRQMRELRAISTRAAISRTSFTNHYEYGDLKANPRDLLVKHSTLRCISPTGSIWKSPSDTRRAPLT
jgi:hypothetical protein